MNKWPKWVSWVILVLGLLYLIKDIMYWGSYWWDLNWWTAAFIIIGLGGLFQKK
jgi:hypothetical protein